MKNNTGSYLFATTKENYEDFSSSRVLYGHSGATNFPIRLLNEIFLRAAHYLLSKNHHGPYTVYDPLCGIAYSLTVMGYLHSTQIKNLIGSDINTDALETANKNISLLQNSGLQKRLEEIQTLFEKYQKPSHVEAAESAKRLLTQTTEHLQTKIFPLDILGDQPLPSTLNKVDIVIADLPYGDLANWSNTTSENSSQILLKKLTAALNNSHIIALIADKKQKIAHLGFKKVSSFKLGKRKIIFLEKLNTNQ
ncbi:MAG: hypothetical protein ACRCZE_03030 [Candidatus Altimarinota bacterium]